MLVANVSKDRLSSTEVAARINSTVESILAAMLYQFYVEFILNK
jgi:hypothetical protein